MSIYLNQANRVLKAIADDLSITPEKVSEIYGFTPEIIINRIETIHAQNGINGKRAADILIETWKRSSPDYINTEYNITATYDKTTFRIKQTPKEVFILFDSPKRSFLHAYTHTGELTESIKEAACKDALKAYYQRTA